MMRIAVIGSGAREHILAYALYHAPEPTTLFAFGTTANPGIMQLCSDYRIGDITDAAAVCAQLTAWEIDLAVIGPEAPLSTGTADALRAAGIAVFGPDRALARIETSKSYTRELLERTVPQASPYYRVVRSISEAERVLAQLGELYVIKADGLCGGKGVKVSQEHLHSHEEALEFIGGLLAQDSQCVIEEKLIGEEFSLMTITDGSTCIHLPVVQDHKRAYPGDTGPNTGGMGSYSDADHCLPFLTPDDILTARELNEQVIEALEQDNGSPYRGVLYGGFMAVSEGVRIIEYNARFGDPEVMNLISVIDADFPQLFLAAAQGTLHDQQITLRPLASVCKYAVPQGYPEAPVKGAEIDISGIDGPCSIYLGSVDLIDGVLVTGGSRTAACVALGKTIEEAERRAETAVMQIRGKLFHRSDIGTAPLIDKRTAHMREIRS
jgi:phosphoribosylamine---glycine ligase